MLPFTEDRDTAGFFAAAREGRLVYRACDDCGQGLHPPTSYCRSCGGWSTRWRDAKGTGVLHTWSTVTHQIHPDFPTPYTIVVVALDDAPDVRLVGRIEGAAQLRAGQKMEVWFENVAPDVALPQWRPVMEGRA